MAKPLIDHISLAIGNLPKSREFYDAILAPLGIKRTRDGDGSSSYARDGMDDFGINQVPLSRLPIKPPEQSHFAFAAADRKSVDAFHAAALKAGGKDGGAPGLRPEYHPHYYAAFVIDPDGYRIEAVCHVPEMPRL